MTNGTTKDQTSDLHEGSKKYKIQISLSKKAVDRVFELRDIMKLESGAQVAREALRIYDILAKEVVAKGGKLFLEDSDGKIVKLKLV